MPNYNPADAVVSLLKPGQYEAVVKRAENQVSRERKTPMIQLILTVYDPAGAEQDVFDYLVFDPTVLFRVRHFCESAGLDFESGSLEDHQCTGKNVRVNVATEKKPGYNERNVVKDYLPRPGNGPTVATPVDDDIPF